MFKFLNFLQPDSWKFIQQLGIVGKSLAQVAPNLSQPYVYQKALTEKHCQQAQLIV
jgi:hypothetical protein